MPSGKVKWYDGERGFGFITSDEGGEVFLHASALPKDVPNPKPGAKCEYSIVESYKGPSAMNVTFSSDLPSVALNQRMSAENMVVVVEDLIKMLDVASNSLRRGRYPENGKKLAQVMRVVADNFEA
ncbi:cold shock domain-containing protein [Actinomyces sp. zg-332]|uniref:cold-shock protein n=1 Tax=Actinomyces sp. zg-332 TaxID=2708340 RepID=UPI00141E0053|nr:cold shock domain-containing protein [Actinomyces sp. zg-332]QPK94337.1 cold shock domain-containing protein [Actinomyces sp. zg-332]